MIIVPNHKKKIKIMTSIQVRLISRESLIIRKIMERKAFLANPKHQYPVSQCGEHDCSAQSQKNRDYYENPSLTYFTDKVWL